MKTHNRSILPFFNLLPEHTCEHSPECLVAQQELQVVLITRLPSAGLEILFYRLFMTEKIRVCRHVLLLHKVSPAFLEKGLVHSLWKDGPTSRPGSWSSVWFEASLWIVPWRRSLIHKWHLKSPSGCLQLGLWFS